MSELTQIVEDAHTMQHHALLNMATENGVPVAEVKNPVVSLKNGGLITEEQSAEFGMCDELYRQDDPPPTTEQVLAYLAKLAGALNEVDLKVSAGKVEALREKVPASSA